MKVELNEDANPTHRKITNNIANFANKVNKIKGILMPSRLKEFYDKNKEIITIIGEGSAKVYKDSIEKDNSNKDLDRPND